MNKFRKKYKILVFTFLLALIHAFIPHVHAQHSSLTVVEASTEANPDVLEMLTRAITFNLGQNHLEDFKDSNRSICYDIALLSPGLIDFHYNYLIEDNSYPAPANDQIPRLSTSLYSEINRGPPSSS